MSTTAVSVALLGFTKFERATFESFFRLASKRNPAYTLALSVAECQAAIVNADDETSVVAVLQQGKLTCSLMLGATPRPGAAAQVPRPINLMLVVRALDQMVLAMHAIATPSKEVDRVLASLADVSSAGHSNGQSGGPTTPATSAGPDSRFDSSAYESAPTMPIPLEAPLPKARQIVTPPAPAAPQPTSAAAHDPIAALHPGHGQHWMGVPRLEDHVPPPTPPTPAERAFARTGSGDVQAPEQPSRFQMDHILVVDDSDVALRFMAQHLQRFGFEVHLARNGTDAIEKVGKRHFEFVFLDVMMEGLDGFHTCKAIKRATYPDHRPPPTVVMLTSRASAVDRLRGTMAGADAYLTKPLREQELLKVVGDREVAKHAFADTAAAASTLI